LSGTKVADIAPDPPNLIHGVGEPAKTISFSANKLTSSKKVSQENTQKQVKNVIEACILGIWKRFG
jgi:hypothetical protein